MSITGIVITLNEEENIQDCVDSLKTVCDEIIVVDSGSTDHTQEIVLRNNIKLIVQDYLGDGPQKQFAVPQAKNDWILSLDADERVSEDMTQEINSLNFNNTQLAFSFPRKNLVGERWIKAGGFYPDRKVRLFNRNTAHYLDKKHHSRVTCQKEVKLLGHIIHKTYKNLDDWMERINQWSRYDAKSMYESGKKASTCRPITRAITAFLRKFLLKGGILQGRDGFLITITTTFRTYLKYEKLNELHKK